MAGPLGRWNHPSMFSECCGIQVDIGSSYFTLVRFHDSLWFNFIFISSSLLEFTDISLALTLVALFAVLSPVQAALHRFETKWYTIVHFFCVPSYISGVHDFGGDFCISDLFLFILP